MHKGKTENGCLICRVFRFEIQSAVKWSYVRILRSYEFCREYQPVLADCGRREKASTRSRKYWCLQNRFLFVWSCLERLRWIPTHNSLITLFGPNWWDIFYFEKTCTVFWTPRMSTLWLDPPPKFFFKPKDWKTWKAHFERYRKATGSANDEEDQVNALLCEYIMGIESETIFNSVFQPIF